MGLLNWLLGNNDGDELRAILGMEDAWNDCRHCGQYSRIGTPGDSDNCIVVADAVQRQLPEGEYKYVVIEGRRSNDFLYYVCCGRHHPQGTRVAWQPCGSARLLHHDLLRVEQGWFGRRSYTVYRARYNGDGTYTASPLEFGSWSSLEQYYRQQYANWDALEIYASTTTRTGGMTISIQVSRT